MNKINRNVVWNDPKAEQCCDEELGGQNDADFKIANDLADKIAGIITNSYANQEIVKNLISNAIVEQIRQYLREYDNVAAEDMLKSLKGWKLGEIKGWTSEVDFDHARHAKLSSFGDELKKEFDRLKETNQLLKVKERILKITPEPSSVLENNDGKVWLSNVLGVIDEEMGIGKEVPEETDIPASEIMLKEHQLSKIKSPGIPLKESD